MSAPTVAREEVPVTRLEFEMVCALIEVIATLPGGLADLMHTLTWQGRNTVEEFGRMRMGREEWLRSMEGP